MRSLARNTTSAESLVANGALPLLLEVLGNGKHSKAVYVQVRGAQLPCRTCAWCKS